MGNAPHAAHAARVFRAMKEAQDGFPLTGRSARVLGVRTEGEFADIQADTQGYVNPNTGGMSVVLHGPEFLPKSRRPRSMGGDGRDPVFAVVVGVLPTTLRVRVDSDPHGLVEPSTRCRLVDYEGCLADTRVLWRKT